MENINILILNKKKVINLILLCLLFFSCKNIGYTYKKCYEKITKTEFTNSFGVNTTNYSIQFKELNKIERENLWFKEIETPFETNYTRLWSSNVFLGSYFTTHFKFIEYYKNIKNIPIAFQFGPKEPMWEYQTYVLKKHKNCFILIRTVYRHARFINKYFAILKKKELAGFYKILYEQNKKPIDEKESDDYCGYFIDNKNNNKFYINFYEDTSYLQTNNIVDTITNTNLQQTNIEKFYYYFDSTIKWQKGYIISQKRTTTK